MSFAEAGVSAGKCPGVGVGFVCPSALQIFSPAPRVWGDKREAGRVVHHCRPESLQGEMRTPRLHGSISRGVKAN